MLLLLLLRVLALLLLLLLLLDLLLLEATAAGTAGLLPDNTDESAALCKGLGMLKLPCC